MPVRDEIVELLRLTENGDGAPSLAAIEATLTEGYAEALTLEGERWRLERRLGEVARAAGATGSAQEFVRLSDQLTIADAELARLRAVLRSLQLRARELRGTD